MSRIANRIASVQMSSIFAGMSAFPITPTDAAGRVDTAGLCRLLVRLKDANVDSVGLLGSTGTYAYLSRAEKLRAVEAAAECLGGSITLIVGIGAMRTDDAIALAQDSGRAGANALLMAPVSYTPLTEEEVYQHYLAVAASTHLPLCIYNNPGTTHFTFSVGLLERLSKLPNIVAVKMPLPANGNNIDASLKSLRNALPNDFAIGYSGDWGCAEGLLFGADSWFSVVGGLLPVPTIRLARAAAAGDTIEAQKIEAHFQPLWELFKELGSLRVVYTAANLLQLTDAMPPRPILPLSQGDTSRVSVALDRLNAIS
jgi:4-hydroxy-tetrahydrodipicolinate synthase